MTPSFRKRGYGMLLVLLLLANTNQVDALGFSSIFGILSIRNRQMADVFQQRCETAKQQGLLHPSGRTWTLQEVQQQIQHEYDQQNRNVLQRWWRKWTRQS